MLEKLADQPLLEDNLATGNSLNAIDTYPSQLGWLDNQRQPMIDLVLKLCNQNSGTFNLDGLAQVKQILVDEFSQLGGEVDLVDLKPYETTDADGNVSQQSLGQVIHIVKRPEAKFKVMLCIHMDTVYGADHSFQECRWLDDQTLNGPGVADAKGGLVVMLNALKMFEQLDEAQNIGWEVIINPDEEIGSPGTVDLINERSPKCDAGILFEPTHPDGTLVSWRKGAGNFSFVVRGKSAHSGRDFHSGRNAVVALARLMSRVDDLNTDEDVTFNVGRIEGGGALNIVPDVAVGHVNVRIKTTEQQAQVEQQFAKLIDEFNQLDGISAEANGEFLSPPKILDEGTQALQKRIEECGEVLGIPIKWQGTGGGCDGNKFLAAGLHNIDTLGPCGGSIHSTDEYLLVDSLVPRTKLAVLILLSFALSSG